MIKITGKSIKEVAKNALNISISQIESPKDDELVVENFAVIEIDDVSSEKDIGFFYDEGKLGYDFDLGKLFPWLDKKIISLEVDHWTEQFIISGKIEKLINHLLKNPFSKRAIADIWDNSFYDLSIPGVCVVYIYFRLVNGGIDMHVHSRANNVYKLLFLDIQAMLCFHHFIGKSIGIKPNKYIHVIDSLHLYKDDYEESKLQINYINNNLNWQL